MDDLLGYDTSGCCPDCKATVMANKVGDKWCSKCTWSNNEEITKFVKGVEEYFNG